MSFPKKIPYQQTITLIWGLFGLIWISLEGHILVVTSMSLRTTAVLLLYVLQSQSQRIFSNLWQWLTATTLIGTAFGITAVGLTLILMAVKTGLHNHGPEFTLQEIQWTIQQFPLWALIGAFLGAGLGLISAGTRSIE